MENRWTHDPNPDFVWIVRPSVFHRAAKSPPGLHLLPARIVPFPSSRRSYNRQNRAETRRENIAAAEVPLQKGV